MTPEEKAYNRSEYQRLIIPKDLSTAHESYMAVVDTAFKIMHDQFGKNITVMGNDGQLLFQMVLLKSLSIQSMAEGRSYQNAIEGKMALTPDTIDVFGIWNIVRSQFESVCTYNHIYIRPTDDNECEMLYDLWQVVGLKYRQRFSMQLIGEENKKKAAAELQDIADLTNRIKDNVFYKSLQISEQQKILNAIKDKTFQIYFDAGRAKKCAWHELCKNMGTNDLFEELYTFLSLNTHPSHVSIFQFQNLYKGKEHLRMTIFAMSISKVLVSFFIRDFCVYFPEAKESFESCPAINQILVNSYNRMFKDDSYQINDIGDQLN
jgi:hypothetical protein